MGGECTRVTGRAECGTAHHMLTTARDLPALAVFFQQAGTQPCHVYCGLGHASCFDQGNVREVTAHQFPAEASRGTGCFCSRAGASAVWRTCPSERLLHESLGPKRRARAARVTGAKPGPAGQATADWETSEKQACAAVSP